MSAHPPDDTNAHVVDDIVTDNAIALLRDNVPSAYAGFRILTMLVRDPNIGRNIVPIVPAVESTSPA